MKDNELYQEFAWKLRLDAARLVLLLERMHITTSTIYLDGWTLKLERNEDGEQHRAESKGD